MNAKIATTSITQGANELLGKKETNLYYLVIETAKGKLTINVGQKTHDEVKRLTEIVNHAQILEPEKPKK